MPRLRCPTCTRTRAEEVGVIWSMFGIVGSLIQLAIFVLIIYWLFSRNRSRRKLGSRSHGPDSAAQGKGEERMKETMLDQMNADLEQSVQTDKTVVIIGVLLNLIFAGVNTGVGAAAHDLEAGLAVKLIFFVLTAFVITLNVAIGYALSTGKKRRVKITERLQKFWDDESLGKYKTRPWSAATRRGAIFSTLSPWPWGRSPCLFP